MTVRWRVELAPSAARAFRRLPKEAQRVLAERIGQLESAGPPPGEVTADGEAMPIGAGEHVLHAVIRPGGVVLIAAIESVDESLSALAGRIARPAVERALGGAGGERDDVVWLRPPRGPVPSVHRRPTGPGVVDLMIEIRRAARALLRHPGLAGLAVLALALGIGLPTAMFGFMDAAVLRGLPIAEPGEVMHVERQPVGTDDEGWSAYEQDYQAWRAQQRSFEILAALRFGLVTLRSESGADRWSAAWVTPDAFELAGIAPALGRTLRSEDAVPGAPPVVVVGHAVWRDRLGGDRDAVGRSVWVDGEARTLVGVMPAGFRFPTDEDVWLPLTLSAAGAPARGDPVVDVLGRLADGVNRSEARSEFAVIAARVAEQYPTTHEGIGVVIRPVTERYMGRTPVRTMYVMLGAVLLVLVIACTNVANLLLVRAVHSMRDLAVRAALGASRARIIRQMMTEAGLLALAGGVGGVLVAIAGIGALERTMGSRMPYWVDLRLNGTALIFALALTVLAALLAGILPALKATSRDLSATLRDETRGGTSLRVGRIMQALVVAEIALSLALLVGTALLVTSVWRVQNVRFDFATDAILTARMSLPDDYDAAERRAFYETLSADLAGRTGIDAVAFGSELPATRSPTRRFMVEGVDHPDLENLPFSRAAAVSVEYFDAYDVTPLQGRVFGPQDGPDGLPVVVVNRRFVERYLAGRDPIGQRIRIGNSESTEPWRTIVGVVPDLFMNALDSPPNDRNPAGLYLPAAQATPATVTFALRTRADPLAAARDVRAATFDLDRDVPLYDVRTMRQLLRDNSWFYGLGAGIMGVCGAAALLLAAIGLYGVIAFSVGRRTREIGIRMAMGARPNTILTQIVRRGFAQIVIGIVIGAGLALFIARGIASLLFQVSPSDPVIFGTVALVLAAIGVAAMLIPARRAARLDPLAALRAE
jgi:putative ABC transport system permease protein